MKVMEKEKFKLNKKIGVWIKSNSTINGGGKRSNKNKILMNRECSEDLGFKKRVIIKDDGRYLIYYDF